MHESLDPQHHICQVYWYKSKTPGLKRQRQKCYKFKFITASLMLTQATRPCRRPRGRMDLPLGTKYPIGSTSIQQVVRTTTISDKSYFSQWFYSEFYLCACESLCLLRPSEGTEDSETGDAGSWEPSKLDTGNWIRVLWKSSKCASPLSLLSSLNSHTNSIVFCQD